MEYLVLQIATFLILATTIGVAVGWWTCKFIYVNQLTECQHELTGLHRNYDDIAKENATLRLQLRQLEQALRKLNTPPSEADYGRFIETRKALETTRRQYEALLEKLHLQEKALGTLRKELAQQKQELAAKKQTAINQNSTPTSTKTTLAPLPNIPESEHQDDLTRIEGINQKLAGKLQAMGIMTYRQLAEFTKDDEHNIQRLVGNDISRPLEELARTARSLFEAKYGQPHA